MVKQASTSVQRQPLTWRMVVSFLLATNGVIAFTAFMMAHWVEKQVLTPDTWVQTVGQLPKNDEVATALSTYTITQLFTATDLENKIEQALPDRAGFLAAPLTDQLQNFLTKQTKRVIQSNQFQAVWISANQAALERLINGARADTTDNNAQPAQVSVPLGVLRDSIKTVLTNRGVLSDSSNSNEASDLVVNIKTSIGMIHQQIRIIDFVNATFWLLALVCVIGALVFSRNKRRLLLIIAVSLIVISLLQLIGVRILRPTILNFFADASATAAAGVVYDTLLASFKQSTVWVLVLSMIGFVIVFLCSAKLIRKSKTTSKWFDTFKASALWGGGVTVRSFFARYQWYIVGVAALVGLTLAAFFIPVSWQSVTLTLLYIILIAELTSLIAGRGRSAPMEHRRNQ